MLLGARPINPVRALGGWRCVPSVPAVAPSRSSPLQADRGPCAVMDCPPGRPSIPYLDRCRRVGSRRARSCEALPDRQPIGEGRLPRKNYEDLPPIRPVGPNFIQERSDPIGICECGCETLRPLGPSVFAGVQEVPTNLIEDQASRHNQILLGQSGMT